jgi:hypothetical protein
MTAELNIHLKDPISTKTVRSEFHKSNIHYRAATAELLITESNAQMRKRWCYDHKTWISDIRKSRVVWSDELSFTLFPTLGKVFVWRIPKVAYTPEIRGWFCVGFGSSIVVQYFLLPLLPFMAELLQGNTWIDWVIRFIQ